MTRVLVTGAAGYVGSRLLARLARRAGRDLEVTAADVRPVPPEARFDGVDYLGLDVRDARSVHAAVGAGPADVVVHLASVVTPGPGSTRRVQYEVDVVGTENVLHACLEHGVRRLVVTSSGAAYGYRADHPAWLDEDHPLRARPAFAYAHHKRLVEERLARCRTEHPELEQVVLRPSTVLGAGVRNQITRLFEGRRVVGLRGGDDRFVFVWDEDVAACLEHALAAPVTGVFNLAGDGAVSLAELARRMGKPYVRLPASLVTAALAVAEPLGLSPYGPEQVRFLRYRPVLANRRLKEVFGYVPQKTSSEVFDLYLAARRAARGDAST